MATGPSGWIRATTTRVKNPACCIDTTEGIWFGLRVTIPSLHAGNVECFLHTQAEHGPVSFTGPSTFVSYQRTPLLRVGGQQGIRTQSLPRGERGYGPSADHPLVPPFGDSARTRTWTHELWRLGCFQLHHAAHVAARLDCFEDKPPYDLTHGSCRYVRPKQKRPSRGSP